MKKALALLLALTMILGLAACAAKQETAEPAPDTTAQPAETPAEPETTGQAEAPAEPEHEPVTIRVASWREADKAVYEQMAAQFQEEYPWITVELELNIDESSYYTNLQADIQDGNAPDVFDVHPNTTFTTYAEEGIIVPLDDLSFLENYSDAAKAVTTINGKNYAFMNAYNLIGILYNKEMFAAAGVAVPTNFEEFLAVCETFRAAGQGGVAYSGGDGSFAGLNNGLFTVCCGSAGYKALIEGMDSGEVTDLAQIPGAETALRTSQAFRDNHVLHDASEGTNTEQAIALFAQGKTPMLYSGTYLFGTKQTSFPEIDAGIFALPTLADTGMQYGQGAQCTAVSASSANVEAAKLWVDFIARPEISSLYCSSAIMISTINGVTLDFEGGEMLSEAIANGVELLPIYVRHNKDYWNSNWKELQQNLLYGTSDYDTEAANYAAFLSDLNLASMS